ncbi:MAG: hypothetical protein ABIO45_01415 [Burkholderiaceae bacterium]
MKTYAIPVLLASVALVTGCGGGGGGGVGSTSTAGTSPLPPAPGVVVFDAQVAWTRLLTTTRSWAVAGRASDGQDYQLTLAVAPGGSDIFPVTGANALKSIFRNRVVQVSTQIAQEVLNEQFVDTGFRQLGSRVSTDGGSPTCSKTDVIAAVPPTGSPAGSSGPLYAATTLSDCSPTASSLGTSFHTWSVVADGGVVYLCVASSNRFLGEPTDRLSETCVETDAAGNLGQHARITLTLPGFSLVATN